MSRDLSVRARYAIATAQEELFRVALVYKDGPMSDAELGGLIGDKLEAIVALLGEQEQVARVAFGLRDLRQANLRRQAMWCPDQVPDLAFRGNELAGEVGEVCNVVKKLERERLGWVGSRDTREHLAEELADVVICADLLALSADVDLVEAVVTKFNATSEKVGLPVKLGAPDEDAAMTGPYFCRRDGIGWLVSTETSRVIDHAGAHFWVDNEAEAIACRDALNRVAQART